MYTNYLMDGLELKCVWGQKGGAGEKQEVENVQ